MGAGDDWQFTDELGNTLGQKVKAMSRVGIYVPGGKAAYPSTIIMTAVPAKVAGVEEIVLCVPTPGGELNDVLLAAAHLCGVDHVFTVGGAQAIAAMAYGTISVPKVDKIVGADRKSTRLNSSQKPSSYAVCCLKKKKTQSNASLCYRNST